jgi:hypothetical protein
MFYEDIFSRLNKQGIKYLVAGGVAVNLHGFVRATMDLDIILLLEDVNVGKFIALVRDAGFKPRVPVDLDAFAVSAKRAEWIDEKGMLVFGVYNPAHSLEQIDVMIDPVIDFADLASRCETASIGTLSVKVVSIPDLIDMKERAGRPRDLMDIQGLRALQEMDDE